MVDLRAKPYNLSDADIAWVESTIAGMTDEEKVGQLLWQLTAGSSMVLNQKRILQKYAKVPVFIACNPEQGGSGVCRVETGCYGYERVRRIRLWR